jgi:hypothetical protein
MKIRHVVMLSTVLVVTAIAAGTASSRASESAALQTRTPTSFLTPLPARLVFTPTDSPYCRDLQGARCPPALVYSGPGGPALPTIEPAFKADLPNVRVSFVLQQISNTAVAGGGINPGATTFVEWLTTSPTASQEKGGPYGYTLPPPGVTWSADEIYHSIIYDALVLDACEAFPPVFVVDHDAVIERNGNALGVFNGFDGATITHTGFYNFSYKVTATENGKVSDFSFKGRVNVTCSGLNSLL